MVDIKAAFLIPALIKNREFRAIILLPKCKPEGVQLIRSASLIILWWWRDLFQSLEALRGWAGAVRGAETFSVQHPSVCASCPWGGWLYCPSVACQSRKAVPWYRNSFPALVTETVINRMPLKSSGLCASFHPKRGGGWYVVLDFFMCECTHAWIWWQRSNSHKNRIS